MDDRAGMSPIVKTVCRFLLPFVVVYGVAVALTGHLSPGGGFAGGVVIACGFVMIVLAMGGGATPGRFFGRLAPALEASGALLFLAAAVLGWLAGGFFTRFLPKGADFTLGSSRFLVWMNVAILLKVGAGLFAGFVALVLFGRAGGGKEERS